MAFKTQMDVAIPQLDDRTKLSHRSLGAITSTPRCHASYKRHSIGMMALLLNLVVPLLWFIYALQVLQALHGCSVQQGHHPPLQATLTRLSTAPCPQTTLQYLSSPAQSLA